MFPFFCVFFAFFFSHDTKCACVCVRVCVFVCVVYFGKPFFFMFLFWRGERREGGDRDGSWSVGRKEEEWGKPQGRR